MLHLAQQLWGHVDENLNFALEQMFTGSSQLQYQEKILPAQPPEVNYRSQKAAKSSAEISPFPSAAWKQFHPILPREVKYLP